MRRITLFLMICFIFTFSESFAKLDDKTVTIEEIVSTVIEHNPKYKAFQNKVQATEQRSLSQSSWDDPRMGMRFNEISTNQFLTEANQKRWFVMQNIPFPGKLTLKGKAIENQALAQKEMRQALRLMLIQHSKEAYYKLYHINKSIEVNEENQRLLNKFQKIANRKYSVGKATQQDVLKAMVELSRLTNDLITLKQIKQTLKARLNTMMNRRPNAPLGNPKVSIKSKFDHKLSDLEQISMKHRQSLKAFEFDIQKRKKEKLLAKLSYAPDLFTRFEYWDNSTKKDMWGAEIGMSVPLWFWHKQIPQVKEASANLYESKANLREEKNNVLFEVKDASVRVGTAQRLANLYVSTVLTQAKQALKAAESGYQTDQVDFLNLIESQRLLESFKLEYFKAISEFYISLAQLESALGKELKQ
jgi:outer membrane protein, heavy metal efflux system